MLRAACTQLVVRRLECVALRCVDQSTKKAWLSELWAQELCCESAIRDGSDGELAAPCNISVARRAGLAWIRVWAQLSVCYGTDSSSERSCGWKCLGYVRWAPPPLAIGEVSRLNGGCSC